MLAIALLALVIAGTDASPHPMPQGVTANIAPSGSPPAACKLDYNGSFGIAVMNATGAVGAAVASQSSEYASLARQIPEHLRLTSLTTFIW